MIYGYMLEDKYAISSEDMNKLESMIEFANNITKFYSYCDNLLTESCNTILTEKFDIKEFGTKIWEKIKAFFKKIKEAFDRFLLNINYLKNARLPKKESDDLQYCLNLMKPRTLDGINDLISLFNYTAKSGKEIDKEFSKYIANRGGRNVPFLDRLNKIMHPDMFDNTDFEFEFGKTLTDINECMNALENSDQYKRLKSEDSYKDEKETIDIPMNNIISDMKESSKALSKITDQLGQVGSAISKVKEPSEIFSKLANMATRVCSGLIRYYKERIALLNIYFTNAKASLHAFKQNLADKGYTTGVSTKVTKTKSVIKGVDIAKLNELRKELGRLNKERDFNGYKAKFAELCKMLHAKSTDTIYISRLPNITDPNKLSEHVVQITKIENKYRKLEVAGKTLYHHRQEIQNYNIQALYPSACLSGNFSSRFNLIENDDIPDTFFPEPRVFCHVSVAMDKAANEMNKRINPIDRMNAATYGLNFSSGWLYIIKNPEQYNVYIDDEQPKTAAYIITEKDVPVEQVDATKVRQDIRNA